MVRVAVARTRVRALLVVAVTYIGAMTLVLATVGPAYVMHGPGGQLVSALTTSQGAHHWVWSVSATLVAVSVAARIAREV